MNRRRFLGLAAGAGFGALAGCSYRPGPGDPRWSVDVGSGAYRPDRLLAAAGAVVAVNRERPGFDFESDTFVSGGRATGYDPATGTERWRVEPGATLGGAAVHDGVLHLGTGDGRVLASVAGERRWSADAGGRVGAVAADGTGAYALVDGPRLVALAGGERRWVVDLPRAAAGALAAAGGRAFVVASGTGPASPSALLAYADGERRWSVPLSGRYAGGAPVAAGGTVYVPADGLVAVDAASGERRWDYSAATSAGVVVAGEVAYLLARGRLHAVAGGEARWVHGPVATLPAVAPEGDGDALYVGNEGLEALDAADGDLRWRSDVPVEAAPVAVDATVAVLGDAAVAGYWRHAP